MVSRSQTAKHFLAYFSRNIRHADPFDHSFCSDCRNRRLKDKAPAKPGRVGRVTFYRVPRWRPECRDDCPHKQKFQVSAGSGHSGRDPKKRQKNEICDKKASFRFCSGLAAGGGIH
jgi:hypothetical protein